MKKVLAIALALCMIFAFAACGEKKEPEKKTTTASFQIGQWIGACHGTKCFSVVTAVIEGDKVVKAYIDEFQYIDHNEEGVVAVDNSDSDFGTGLYAGDNWLCSKRESDVYYTNALKNKASATMDYVENLKVIEAYCEGKTIAELEPGVDAISGCTLTDASGYVKGVAEAAKLAKNNPTYTYEYEGELNVTLKMIIGAAHGTKCFSIGAALSDGTKVICAYVDEFQAMDSTTEGLVAVPNSDTLASNVVEGKVLMSKRTNNSIYSANMATKGGATQEYAVNMAAVEAFVAGKTIEELGSVDSVSGCTFTDASGYVKLIVEAAK